MTRLDRLESESINIIREAYAVWRDIALLWSVGKDSTALLWLVRKAFLGKVPFPVVHVDTSYKIPEMIAFRNRIVREWGLRLIVGKNSEVIAAGKTYPLGAVGRIECCRALKTQPLISVINNGALRYEFDPETEQLRRAEDSKPFRAILAGIRCDEEGTRSKERIFSLRASDGRWALSEQPAELWSYYNTQLRPGEHARVHPILEWTELDIWEYIAREKLEVVSLYFSKEGERYRSLGCASCSSRIRSNSSNVEEIVAELKTGELKNTRERAGRLQDKEDVGGGLEQLRKEGYM